jgi:DNA polymerase-3 subunit alpha
VVECAEQILRHAAAGAESAADEGQVSLFGDALPSRPPRPKLAEHDDWPTLDRLQSEFEVLGLYLSAHPLDGYASALARLGVASGDRLRVLAASGEGARLKLAGVVVAKQERVTERTRLARVILSDATAQYEVTVFAELLTTARELLEGKAPLLVEADARVDGDMLRLTAGRIQLLDEVAEVEARRGRDPLATPAAASRLKPILQRSVRRLRPRRRRPRPARRPLRGEEAVVTCPRATSSPAASASTSSGLEGVLAVRDVAAAPN